MNGRRNERPTDRLEPVSLTAWHDIEARQRAAVVGSYPFLHLQLGSVGEALLPLRERKHTTRGQSEKKLVRDDIIETIISLLFLLPGDWSQPAWPSPAAASGPPAPGPCRVTGPSASRSQLRSARRAAPRQEKTDKVKIRTLIQTMWIPFKTEN